MKQGGPQGTGDVMPSFRPIQTAPRNTVATGEKLRSLDPQHLRKPLPACYGNVQPFALTRYHEVALRQRIRKRHAEFSRQVIIASAGASKCFQRRRASTGTARRQGQQCQALKRGSDLRAGQSLIAVAPFALHGQQSTLGQSRELRAGARQRQAGDGGQLPCRKRPSVRKRRQHRRSGRVADQGCYRSDVRFRHAYFHHL